MLSTLLALTSTLLALISTLLTLFQQSFKACAAHVRLRCSGRRDTSAPHNTEIQHKRAAVATHLESRHHRPHSTWPSSPAPQRVSGAAESHAPQRKRVTPLACMWPAASASPKGDTPNEFFKLKSAPALTSMAHGAAWPFMAAQSLSGALCMMARLKKRRGGRALSLTACFLIAFVFQPNLCKSNRLYYL